MLTCGLREVKPLGVVIVPAPLEKIRIVLPAVVADPSDVTTLALPLVVPPFFCTSAITYLPSKNGAHGPVHVVAIRYWLRERHADRKRNGVAGRQVDDGEVAVDVHVAACRGRTGTSRIKGTDFGDGARTGRSERGGQRHLVVGDGRGRLCGSGRGAGFGRAGRVTTLAVAAAAEPVPHWS